MPIRQRASTLPLALGMGAALLLTLASTSFGQDASGQQPSTQPAPPASTESAAGNQVALSFDLGTCQQLGPGLYQCPSSDKPICDPGYNKGDVDCIRIDANGVLIKTY